MSDVDEAISALKESLEWSEEKRNVAILVSEIEQLKGQLKQWQVFGFNTGAYPEVLIASKAEIERLKEQAAVDKSYIEQYRLEVGKLKGESCNERLKERGE